MMGLEIELQGARAAGGGNGFQHGIFIWRYLADDGQGPLAVGTENEAGGRVEADAVATGAYGRRGDDGAGVGVGDYQQIIGTDGKQAPVFFIQGQAARLLAGASSSGAGL